MIMNIYAVRDNAVAAFLQPFFAPTNAAAIRSLTQAVNDTNHEFHKHAADYSLWVLGTYDDSNGIINPSTIDRLISCVDLLNKN